MFLLPREAVRDTIYKMLEVVLRYLAGDVTLIKEIERNRLSTDGVCELARNTLEHLSEPKRPREESGEAVDRALKMVRVDDQERAAFRNDICNSLKQSLRDMIPGDFFQVVEHDRLLQSANITAGFKRVETIQTNIEKLMENHTYKSQRIDEQHQTDMIKLNHQHEKEIQRLIDEHRKGIDRLKAQHQTEVNAARNRERGDLITINQVFKERTKGRMPTDAELKWIGCRAKTMFNKRMKFCPEVGEVVSTTCNYRANLYYQRDWHLIELLVRKLVHQQAADDLEGIDLDQLENAAG